MNVSRMKKLFAGVSTVAIALTQMGTALAAYTDVPSGVWYEDAVMSFMDNGYLDASQTRFRGSDPATRSEFIKLVVELNGGILGTAPAQPSFDDVAPGSWYYNYMEEAAKEGWVRGDNNCYGSHPCYGRPGAMINRAEAAALIVRAFGLEWSGDAPQFVDNPSGQWYTDVIQTAADHCVLQGDDSTGRVRPGDYMNRAEMVTMLYRVDQALMYGVDCGTGGPSLEAGITNVDAISATKVEVEFTMPVDMDEAEMASSYAVTAGTQTINVVGAASTGTRTVELTLEQALSENTTYTLTVSNMMTMDGKTFSDSGTFTWSSTPQGNGSLEVSLSSRNPVGDSVPKGANGVTMLSLDLEADCMDDVVIEDLTILHQGFGRETDIAGVYAAFDGGRVTRKRTLDSQSQTATVRFTTPLIVPACQTKTLDIMADFSSTADTAAEHSLAVELSSDVVSNAKSVSGNFPMRGNQFRVAAVTSGELTLTYRSVSPSTIKVGDLKKVVGKFELSTDSVEDQTIYSMTFENDGSSNDGDLTNIAVRKSDGTILTNVAASTVGGYVTLTFNPPFTILQGDKLTLEVIADIVGGAADTAIIQIEETSDIFAVGSLYGYGVNGQLYGSQITLTASPSPTTVTIDAGQFTVEVDGPVQQKYRRDSKDAVLGNLMLTTGGEALNIRDMFVAVQGQTSSGGGLQNQCGTSVDNIHELLEGVDLRNTVTGRTISAVRLTGSSDFATGTATNSTYQIYRFDDFVADGKQSWQLRADFIDNGSSSCPKSGNQFRVHVCTQPTGNSTGCDFGGLGSLSTGTTTYNMDVEGLSTGDRVSDIRPGGTISGNFHRIATPTLTVAVLSTGSSDTTVKNAKNIELLRFEARAGEADDILVTRFIFAGNSGSLLNAQNYTIWVDTDGDRTVDTKLESGKSAQSSKITFDQLLNGGYIIPKETTVVFEVHADISANTVNNDLQIIFDSSGSAGSYIEAEQALNGSSLSGIKTNASCSDSGGNCDIIVTTTSTKNWLIAAQGDLFVIKDTVPLRSRQLLGGAVGEPILRLRFRASNEDIDVTDLQFTTSGGTAASLDALDLYFDGATTPFVSATNGACGSDDYLTRHQDTTVTSLCANMESHQLVVTKGVDKTIIVRPRIKTDDNGATSNDTIQIFLSNQAVSNNTTGSGAVRGRGMQSSNNLSANDADATAEGEVFVGVNTPTTNAVISGNKNVTVLAKVDSITNANPDANGQGVPTGIAPFGQFKFTALPNSNSLGGLNKFTLSGVIFNVNASNVNMDTTAFKFYNKADSSTKTSCTSMTTGGTTIAGTASGSFLVECRGLIATSVNTTLNSGENATFVLEGNVTNAKVTATNSTLLASIQNFSSMSNTTFAASTSHISWVDQDSGTPDAAFLWIEYPDTVINSTTYGG